MAGPVPTPAGQPPTAASSPAGSSAGSKPTPTSTNGRTPTTSTPAAGTTQTSGNAPATVATEKPPSAPASGNAEAAPPARKPVSVPPSVRGVSAAAGSPATPTTATALPSTGNDEVADRRPFREPGKNNGGPVTKEECEFWLSKLQDEKLDLSKRAMIGKFPSLSLLGHNAKVTYISF